MTLLYALGVWEVRLPAETSKRLMAAMLDKLASLEPKQLSNLLWACARLGMYPTGTWFKSWFDASFRLLPAFKPGDLSQVRPPAPRRWRRLARGLYTRLPMPPPARSLPQSCQPLYRIRHTTAQLHYITCCVPGFHAVTTHASCIDAPLACRVHVPPPARAVAVGPRPPGR